MRKIGNCEYPYYMKIKINNMNISLRNGDWSFIPTTEKLEGELQKHNGEYTFAEGEATGHFHKVIVRNKENMIFTKLANGGYMVELKEEGIVTHPEHSMKSDLVVAPGRYILKQRREKDWFQLVTRKVVD